MNSSVYGPYTKDGVKLHTWMTAFGHWAFYAEREGLYTTGTVEADNRVEAWNLAWDQAKRELWTADEILRREG